MIDISALERRYLDPVSLRAERTGLTLMTVTEGDGNVLENVEPHRLFPFTDPFRYISLLDEKGVEKGLITDLAALEQTTRETIVQCLEAYYFIPKITRVNKIEEKFDVIHFYVDTDHGPCVVDVSITIFQMRMQTPTRLLIRDNSSGRFEVPDITKLPPKSYKLLKKYL